MAEKISIEIALEGGAEIERQLADIGTAGQKAFADITKAASQVGFKNIQAEQVTAALQRLGVTGVNEITKIQNAVKAAGRLESLVQGVASVENAFARVGAGVETFASHMTRSLGPVGALARAFGPGGILVGGIAGAAVVFEKFAFSASRAINQVSEAADKLGIPFQRFDQLRKGFEAAGIGSDIFARGMTKVVQEGNLTKVLEIGQRLQAVLGAGLPLGFINPKDIENLRNFALEEGKAGDQARAFLALIPRITTSLSNLVPKTAQQAALQQLGLPLTTDIQKNFERITDGLNRIDDEGKRTRLTIALFGDELGPKMAASMRVGTFSVDAFRDKVGALTETQRNAATLQEESLERLKGAWNRFAATVAIPATIPLLDDLTKAIENSQGTIVGAIQNLAEAMLTALKNAFTGEGSKIINSWLDEIQQNVDIFVQNMQIAGAKVAQAFQFLQSAATPETQSMFGGGMAAGGLIGGSGTGTSDSNLAWVSRGEYVVPAAAVAQPGMLAFLEGLRRTGGNLGRVLDGMSSFALGGLVQAPRFAEGGLAGGMSNVTIQFPGVQPISGLHASSPVVDELRHAAALAQVRSGGRKPSRYS